MDVNTLDIKPKVIAKTKVTPNDVRKTVVDNMPLKNPILSDILEESGQEVYSYLEKNKITQSQNILFLSLTRHYLYSSEELKKVNTIINFKFLNRIPHIGYYLFTMNRILSINGYFVGCFVDYKIQKQLIINKKNSLLKRWMLFMYRFVNRVIPRMPILNHILLLTNSGRIKCFTREEAVELLQRNGFQTTDLKEMEGCTYFIARKVKNINNESFSLQKLMNHYKSKSQIINI